MANRIFKPFGGAIEAGVVKLFGVFTIGAAGAITASSTKGFTVTKTAAKVGRYTIALQDKYNALLGYSIQVEGPADAAYGSGGVVTFVRGVDVGAAVPQLFIQLASAAASPADTDAPTGTRVYVELTLKNSTAW